MTKEQCLDCKHIQIYVVEVPTFHGGKYAKSCHVNCNNCDDGTIQLWSMADNKNCEDFERRS